MIDLLESELCKTLVAFLLFASMVILFIIFKEGAAEDARSRTFYGIDKFVLPFLAVVAIPHVYFAYCLFCNGFILLYIFNLGALILLWYLGNHYVIGGADALCFIFVGLLLPFVFPLVFLTISTLIVEKIMRWRSPSRDAEWSTGKVPLLVPGLWGYLITLPLSALLLLLIALGL